MGLSASRGEGDEAEGSGGEQSEAGGLGCGGWGLWGDGEGELKRWSEGVVEEVGSSLKLIGSWNKGDIEGSLVLRGRKLCGHHKPAIGYGAIQIGDVCQRVGVDG